MENQINIRSANLSDLEEIQTLFIETIKGTCNKDYNKNQIDLWVSSVENIERWNYKITSQYFRISEIKNRIVGFASLENGNHLDLMFVHKNYLRHGIANLLYEDLKRESRRLGFEKLTADVSITAKPFFEKTGFRVVKENENMLKGIEIVNYSMIE